MATTTTYANCTACCAGCSTACNCPGAVTYSFSGDKFPHTTPDDGTRIADSGSGVTTNNTTGTDANGCIFSSHQKSPATSTAGNTYNMLITCSIVGGVAVWTWTLQWRGGTSGGWSGTFTYDSGTNTYVWSNPSAVDGPTSVTASNPCP